MGGRFMSEQTGKINFKGKEYNISDLSDDGRAQVQNLSFAEAEIKRLTAQLAIAKTAHNAYAQALEKILSDTARH
jgi:hypothetical protein